MKTNRRTIADVARHAGVSTATVSRVINNSGIVDAKTAECVRASIKVLEYVPHAAARTLASQRTNTIGFLLPEISGIFFQPLLRGVETAAGESGYDLLIHTTRNPEAGNSPRRPLAEHNTDGLLVFTNSLDSQELGRLFKNGFPVILLHQTPPEGAQLPVVTIENQSGSRELVTHLIKEHDRQHIVFLQGPKGEEDSKWREKGYREALKDFDIPFDPRLVRRGGFDREEARQSVGLLLQEGVEFDAVFAGDDEASVGVLLALRQAGRNVPEEISVVGFDDQVFAETLLPPLSTVRAPTEQVGIEAVRMLVQLIRGEIVPKRLTLPVELVIRESCGCPHRSHYSIPS